MCPKPIPNSFLKKIYLNILKILCFFPLNLSKLNNNNILKIVNRYISLPRILLQVDVSIINGNIYTSTTSGDPSVWAVCAAADTKIFAYSLLKNVMSCCFYKWDIKELKLKIFFSFFNGEYDNK